MPKGKKPHKTSTKRENNRYKRLVRFKSYVNVLNKCYILCRLWIENEFFKRYISIDIRIGLKLS